MKLQVKNVSKSYTSVKALDRFSFTFREGITALLGPNGAGKSTLMNLIADQLTPDRGRLVFHGRDIHEMGADYRKLLGYMPQQQKMYDSFSVLQFMKYIGALKGLSGTDLRNRIDHLLALVHLSSETHYRLGALSGGMKQRLLIAQALLNDPAVLLLDEPTAGLDPEERIRIRNLISSLAENRIIIYSTHVVSDIEVISDCIVCLKNGRIAAAGREEVLIRSLQGYVFTVDAGPQAFSSLEKQYLISSISRTSAGEIQYRLIGREAPSGTAFTEVMPSLEDFYLALYQGDLYDDTNPS